MKESKSNAEMDSIKTMKLVIRYEYEKEELIKWNPKSFKDYLFYKYAELRINKIDNHDDR